MSNLKTVSADVAYVLDKKFHLLLADFVESDSAL